MHHTAGTALAYQATLVGRERAFVRVPRLDYSTFWTSDFTSPAPPSRTTCQTNKTSGYRLLPATLASKSTLSVHNYPLCEIAPGAIYSGTAIQPSGLDGRRSCFPT